MIPDTSPETHDAEKFDSLSIRPAMRQPSRSQFDYAAIKMGRETLDERFRVDVGRADGGRSFVRVTDKSTGIDRTQVGFNGESAETIARRLAAEIMADSKTDSSPNQKRTFEIDGNDFATLEEFYDIISRTMIPGSEWGRNLDAFNDILRGGFGTPDDGFTIHWHNSSVSRNRLGYPETIRQLKLLLSRCHPSNIPSVQQQLAVAESHNGDTVFDWLSEIIFIHCEGGEEGGDGVTLILD